MRVALLYVPWLFGDFGSSHFAQIKRQLLERSVPHMKPACALGRPVWF